MTVRVSVWADAAREEFSYAAEGDRPCVSGNTALVAALLPAMKAGTPVRIEQPVSRVLRENVLQLQPIFSMWFPELRPVEVIADAADSVDYPDGRAVALFFTGGLDSWHTLLSRRSEVTTLIHVVGTGYRTPQDETFPARLGREVSDALGLRWVEVFTDVRSFLDKATGMRWGHTHFAALASVAHLFPESTAKVYVGASSTWAELGPWGSHPLTDHLWSSDAIRFVHHGCDSTRLSKARDLAENDLALQSLHVCTHQPYGQNCGNCEKCQRTMLTLHAVGALERCGAFPGAKLNAGKLARTAFKTEHMRSVYRECLEALRGGDRDPEIQRAIAQALAGGPLPRRLTRMARNYLRSLVERDDHPNQNE